MTHLSTWIAFAAVLGGGFVQSATGFGFALVASPALAATFGPHLGVPSAAVLGAAVNVLTLAGERRRLAVLRPTAAVLLAASVPGMALGALVLVHSADDVLRVLVALVVLASVAAYLRSPHVPLRRAGAVEALAAGAVSGVLGTASGINGPPLLLHLRRRGAVPTQVRDTLAAIFLVIGALTLAVLAVAGALRVPTAIVLLLAGAVAGQALGRVVFHRLGERHETAARATLALSAGLAVVAAVQALAG